ncbi:MAG: hypothetical protein HKN43_12365, partial [Rhodothermales bacterium]|nr:hypothetical protein [Rhodothermales bacterium]
MQDRNDNVWYDDRVEQYVDGLLARDDLIRFEDRLQADDDLNGKVEFARQIQASLEQLPSPEMPDAVVVNVQRAIATIGANGKNSAGQLRLVSIGHRRVAYAAVAFAACFALLLIVRPEILSVDQQPDQVPSQAEVDQALMEVKQTLAFVSDMGHERNT